MNIPWSNSIPFYSRGHDRRGFTIAETLIATTVGMAVLAGMITIHLFGLRLLEFAKPKMTASDNARDALGKLMIELRSANSIRVGSGSQSTFSSATSGSLLQGNAVQVFATTNTNAYAIYYLDADKLRRRTTSSTNIDTIANSISNGTAQVFTVENYSGTVLTNDIYNSVIGVLLQFRQMEYPNITIGTNRLMDTYQLRGKVTQRVWDSTGS